MPSIQDIAKERVRRRGVQDDVRDMDPDMPRYRDRFKGDAAASRIAKDGPQPDPMQASNAERDRVALIVLNDSGSRMDNAKMPWDRRQVQDDKQRAKEWLLRDALEDERPNRFRK